MTARRLKKGRATTAATRPLSPARRPVRLWLHPLLTQAEIRKLKARAQDEMRTVGNLVAWLILRDLARPVGRRRRLPNSRGPRERFGIGITLSRAEKAALDERLALEVRSVSNYVQVVVVEALRGAQLRS